LDSDFLYTHPYALRYARDFSNARRTIDAGGARMNRMYAAEPTPTITGSNADHRVAVSAQDILSLTQIIASNLGIGTRPTGEVDNKDWVEAVVRDLHDNRSAGVIIGGETLPPEVTPAVTHINMRLGKNGVVI